MAKTIIKELIIALLLCLAIILVLGILFYEYVPMSKTIPNPVSYHTDEEVKKELASSESIDADKVIMTYEVDSTDLNNYKRVEDYKPGKANPFSSYEKAENETGTQNGNSATGNNSNSTSTSQSGSSSNSTTSSSTTSDNKTTETSIGNSNEDNTSSSGGKYFQDKGTK